MDSRSELEERTIRFLRSSSKGQLVYEPDWPNENGLQEIIDKCKSPPSIYLSPTSRPRPSPQSSVDNKTTTTPPSLSRPSLQSSAGNKTVTPTSQRRQPSQSSVDNKSTFTPPTGSSKTKDNNKQSPKPSEEKPNEEENTPDQWRPQPPDPVALAILQYEEEIHQKTRLAIERRQKEFEETLKRIWEQGEQIYNSNVEVTEQFQQSQGTMIDEWMKRHNEHVEQNNRRITEMNKHRVKLLESRIKEAEAHKQLKERQREEFRHRVETIRKLQQDMNQQCEQVTQLLASCVYPQHIPDPIRNYSNVLAEICQQVELIIRQSHVVQPSDEQFKTVIKLCSRAKNTADLVLNAVDAANTKGREEEEKEAAAKAAAAAAAAAVNTAAVTAPSTLSVPVQPSLAPQGATTIAGQPVTSATASVQPTQVAQASEGAAAAASSSSVDGDVMKEYQRLLQKKQEAEKLYSPIVTEAQLKKYRVSLQKAVNTPVNAIAKTSGSHLRDKLERICKLLSGQQVEVGGQQVSAAAHPAGSLFCQDLFAKKIVKQGDEQVSVSHDSAIVIATVAVGVWCQFPEVGDLLLGHFYAKCPYTVPYYIPRRRDQPPEDYLKLLGYQFEDGAVEPQDKYLRRMSGMMRLYAAIITATPPPGLQTPHPHGVEQGWKWLVRLLNLEPQADTTATMLFDFLEVAGSSLLKTYGKQFIKLLTVLKNDFLPKLHRVTSKGEGGPVSRLEMFIAKCIRLGSIPPPEGLLPHNFWST